MSNQNPIYADMRNVQYSNSLKAVPSTSNASNALQPKFTQLPTSTPDASLAQYYPMDKTHGTIPQLRPQGAKSNAVVPILDQERFLPIANVSRIMKQMIPSTGKIAKEAKECVQECVSEFISFITSEASDRCIAEKRKTISADDLLEAMVSLGFDNYIEPMTIMLHRYRTVHKLSSNVGRTDRFSDPFHLAPLGPPGQPRVSHAEPPAMSEPPPTLTRVSSSIPVFDSKSVVGQVPDRKRNEIHQISQMAGGSYGMRSGMHNSSVEQPTHTTGSVPHSVNRAPPAVSHAAAAVPHPSQPSPGQQQVPADAVALEQSNVQIYVDPITKQHYIAVESAEGGTQLFPITIQGGPVATITDGEENTIQEQQQHQQYMMVQGENDHGDQQPQQLSHQGAMTYSTGHVSSRGDTNGSCVQQKTFSSDKPPVLEAEGGPVRTQRRLTNNRPAPYKGKQ